MPMIMASHGFIWLNIHGTAIIKIITSAINMTVYFFINRQFGTKLNQRADKKNPRQHFNTVGDKRMAKGNGQA